MRKFVITLIIFVSPIIVFLAFPSFIFYSLKENFFDIDNIVKTNNKYLIGYVYNETNYRYLKWVYLNLNSKKEVWTLGSSRVLSFRAEMFDNNFYNAGYTISGLNDFIPFMESIPRSKYPKYLIIGLDQWMFNARHDSLNTIPSNETWMDSFNFYPQQFAYFGFYKDLIDGKYKINLFKQTNSSIKIGINAVINNKGFKNDGSMYYGSQIVKLINNEPTANDYMYKDTFNRIKRGVNLFEFGDSVNPKALLRLDELLKFCTENQIHVVAFMPPYSDQVYERMDESGNYVYLKKIYPEIKPIFDKYSYEIYDFSTVSSVDSSDTETLDGFHGSDVTYQRLLIKILNSGSMLNHVSDVYKLKRDLSKKINNYSVYED